MLNNTQKNRLYKKNKRESHKLSNFTKIYKEAFQKEEDLEEATL